MGITLSGLASGIDYNSIVDQLIQLERAPEKKLRAEQNQLQQQNNAYTSLKTQFSVLQGKLNALTANLFDSRQATVSDAAVARVTAAAGTALGGYTFTISQLAAAAVRRGATNAGAALNSANALSEAGFATAITGGTITVNGQSVTVAATDTLAQVFDNISAATGGAVTGSYDAGTDTITLASAGEIVLGSATDTSNLLNVARLANNSTGTITSAGPLGAVKLDAKLHAANFAAVITGAGEFKINGVSFTYDAATDRVSDVLARINNSTAGVTASYDPQADRFTLTNKTTGDIGFALTDVTGNFLAATGLVTGALQRGQNLFYSVNGGDPIVSQSNTISAASSGLTGLAVTALQTGVVSVQVGADTETIKAGITDFVAAYNNLQSLIDTNTASTTDANGKVTAGLLAGEGDVSSVASRLRGLVAATVPGLTGTLSRLGQLGYQTSGYDNSLTLDNAAALDSALTNKLNDLKEIFTDATNGIATKLTGYLDEVTGDNGWLAVRQQTLTKQSTDIDRQIEDMERRIESERTRLQAGFLAMEQAQQRISTQLQYLTQQMDSLSSNSSK